LKSPKDWSGAQTLSSDINNFLKENSNSFNYGAFLDYLRKKYTSDEFEKNMNSQDKQYMDFLNHIQSNLNSSAQAEDIQNELDIFVQTRMDENKSSAKAIVSEISRGKAINLSTCGSVFMDTEKKDYPNCQNHSVTATGFKCIAGQLKIETTNSWGIGCTDSQKSKNLVDCERDADGITNGRSWVDYNYLSNQGMGFTIIK
jgi:hypothetical protein